MVLNSLNPNGIHFTEEMTACIYKVMHMRTNAETIELMSVCEKIELIDKEEEE